MNTSTQPAIQHAAVPAVRTLPLTNTMHTIAKRLDMRLPPCDTSQLSLLSPSQYTHTSQQPCVSPTQRGPTTDRAHRTSTMHNVQHPRYKRDQCRPCTSAIRRNGDTHTHKHRHRQTDTHRHRHTEGTLSRARAPSLHAHSHSPTHTPPRTHSHRHTY